VLDVGNDNIAVRPRSQIRQLNETLGLRLGAGVADQRKGIVCAAGQHEAAIRGSISAIGSGDEGESVSGLAGYDVGAGGASVRMCCVTTLRSVDRRSSFCTTASPLPVRVGCS